MHYMLPRIVVLMLLGRPQVVVYPPRIMLPRFFVHMFLGRP